ncbi:Vta1 [Kluyveromyces lactis]|nr:Vta1 [Kluyveromyces lactis]
MGNESQYKRVLKLSKELSTLPVISYYLKLYAAELILNEKERDGEATELVMSLLDDVESFKNEVNDEGTKVLLNEKDKALAFVLNLAMSIYNGILVQIQDDRINDDIGKGLWCCIDLFQCCKHIWADSMDAVVKEQCDKRIKHSKYYLMKLKRGQLQSEKKPQQTTSEPTNSNPLSEVEDEIPNFVEDLEDQPLFEEPKDSQIAQQHDPSPYLGVDESVEKLKQLKSTLPTKESPEVPIKLTTPEPIKLESPKPAVRHDVATLKEIMSREHRIQKAQRSAKYAISALNYDDIVTAKAELQQAFKLIEDLTPE